MTEKRKVQKKGRYQIRVPAFVIQKGEFMAQKKRLSKFLPRLLAAAVAAATLIGSGGIGGISVYARRVRKIYSPLTVRRMRGRRQKGQGQRYGMKIPAPVPGRKKRRKAVQREKRGQNRRRLRLWSGMRMAQKWIP